MELEIQYSLFSDTIAKQLKTKKINFDKEKVKTFQENAFYAMALHFHELISDSQRNTILHKNHKRLEKHISDYEIKG